MMMGILMSNTNFCFLSIIIQVYKDLLAVTSTSSFVFIKLTFNGTAMKESFYGFLLNQLEFSKTTEFPEVRAKNDDDMDVCDTIIIT